MKQYSTIYCNIIQYNAIEYNMIRYVAISSCNKIRDLLCIMENNSNIDKLYIYREYLPVSSGPRRQRRWFGSMGSRAQRFDWVIHGVMHGYYVGNIMGIYRDILKKNMAMKIHILNVRISYTWLLYTWNNVV